MLWIRDFLVRIRIRGSVPLTNGSGSESCKFIAHLVRSQVTELRESSLFIFELRRWGWVKILEQKKTEVLASFWSRSESRIRIRVRIWDPNPDSNPDLDPDSNPDPNPKLTSGRIRIRDRIRNFVSDPQHWWEGSCRLHAIIPAAMSGAAQLWAPVNSSGWNTV